MAKHIAPNSNITALDIIEQAFYLLRKLPAQTLFLYYLGTMPFITGLLYFFSDMSKNAFAHEYCLTASLGLTILFVWMKTWQAVFCIKTFEFLGQYSRQPFSFGRAVKLSITQTIIHASGIIILPVASILMIPFAWTFAMYQMILIPNNANKTPIKAQIKENVRAASNDTFLNHMVISIFSIFGLFVFLNITIAIYIMPFLIKSLFGLESNFTMGGFNVFNTTFLLSAVCITHLLVDPLVKIVYVIQKYYFDSQKTGDDLISNLNQIKNTAKKTGPLLVLLFVLFLPQTPSYAQTGAPFKDTQNINAQDLDTAIDHVLSRREYTWRMPRDTFEKQGQTHGFIYKALKWITSQIKIASDAIARWIEDIYNWLRKLFVKDKKPVEYEAPKSLIKPGHMTAGLIILVIILLSAILVHLKKLKSQKPLKPKTTKINTLDISDENILASQLPGDQWLSLAQDLLEKGDLRLAVRALYLGTLAMLSDRHFIRIARHKSNLDYQLELSQKAHTQKTMLTSFADLVQTVDRVWYGMHTVNRIVYDEFLSTQKRMMLVADE